jgi:hypothetical protein
LQSRASSFHRLSGAPSRVRAAANRLGTSLAEAVLSKRLNAKIGARKTSNGQNQPTGASVESREHAKTFARS